jgi:hypothetical protein
MAAHQRAIKHHQAGGNPMWRKVRIRGAFLLLLLLMLSATQKIEAQDLQVVPRSELFGSVVGAGLGKALGQAMNAYALGKAQREELDNLRSQIAKCGNSCSDELKTKLNEHQRAQAAVEGLIEDIGFKNNMGVAWTNAMKSFLSIEPAKMTPDQKAWIDMNIQGNIIATYCYTISDQMPTKQQKCVENTPYQIARDVDILISNMCYDKVSKEVNMNLKDQSYQLNPDKEVAIKYNGALWAARECFESASYYYGWMKSVYHSCGKDWNDRRANGMVMKPKDVPIWCVPDPTDNARDYKLLSSQEVEFNWDWLNPGMWGFDVRPKVRECIYGEGLEKSDTAKFYFWAQEPPAIRIRTKWGGAITTPLSEKGLGGEKIAYDLVGDGHYLGLQVVDKCPADLEKAIRLRQELIAQTRPSYLSHESKIDSQFP